ncbi:cuticular protein, putative [Ixodes scapularis]|uniref:Cuticular protein, putative n=1 Tax=Ixodes scapularis TaxID=6945 RepID=B7PRL1_IXOSC|nr:cuticular protein, putative [Ixodes scapularis]|eukprot:XP_002400127.1 cuticular protein, putative [Ixodes scapularis]
MSCHRVCFLALGEWWPRVGQSAPGSAPLRTPAVPSGGVRRGSAGGAAAPGCLREFTGTQRGQGTPLSASFLVAALVLATSSSYAASLDRSDNSTGAALEPAAVVNATASDTVGDSGGFSCEGRIFGYYGDPANCSLFHYCEPFADPENNQFVLHAAYLCPNDTVFNQLSLTCAYAHEALPCRRAPEYYYINSHVVPADTAEASQGTTEASSGSTSTAAPTTTEAPSAGESSTAPPA